MRWGLGIAIGALAVAAAFGHGASKGLHVHVDPEEAAPGETVTVALDGARPLVSVRVGIPGTDRTVERTPVAPSRHVEVDVAIPESARGVVSVHAEATTVDGTTVRAAALVRTRPPKGVKSLPGGQTQDGRPEET